MSNQLLGNLRDANPIPHPDRLLIDEADARAFLATVQERRHGMANKTQPEMQPTEAPPRPRESRRDSEAVISVVRGPRRRFVYVLAAAIVALIVGSVAWIAFLNDGGSDVAGIPLIGADGDAVAQEAFAGVESAFAAFNSGDMDTWVLWRDESEATGADYAYELAAEARIDIEQCTYRGLAEWDFDGPLTGHGFDCAVTQTDLILEAAGIELEMTYNWVIGADPESSLGGSNEDFMFVDELMGEYRNWLATSHPDVEASIQYSSGEDYPTARSVPTALEYIDEFVAQSDVYPLTEPVPEADYYGGPLDECQVEPRSGSCQ